MTDTPTFQGDAFLHNGTDTLRLRPCRIVGHRKSKKTRRVIPSGWSKTITVPRNRVFLPRDPRLIWPNKNNRKIANIPELPTHFFTSEKENDNA